MAKRKERLPCGCRAWAASYKFTPNNWGRVNVEPTCNKKSHRDDLEQLTRSMREKW